MIHAQRDVGSAETTSQATNSRLEEFKKTLQSLRTQKRQAEKINHDLQRSLKDKEDELIQEKRRHESELKVSARSMLRSNKSDH